LSTKIHPGLGFLVFAYRLKGDIPQGVSRSFRDRWSNRTRVSRFGSRFEPDACDGGRGSDSPGRLCPGAL